MYTDVTGNIGADVVPVIATLFIIVMVTATTIAVVVTVIKRLVNLHTDIVRRYIIKRVLTFVKVYDKSNVTCVYMHTVLVGLHYDS